NEANDYSCVLTDDRGNVLAQNTASLPNFIGTLPQTVRHFLREIGADNMSPGDVLITNNPWMGTGHLNDVTVVKPIFYQDRLVAFAGTTGHVPDIGGKLRSVEPREVFEEGFHIPPMKLLVGGVADQTLLTLLRRNVRTPDQTVGDIFAQVGALGVMERRLLRLLEDYRLTSLVEFGDEIFRRSELAMREAIRALPNGTYRYEMQTDGLQEPFTFKVALTVLDDTIEADYEGSSPQQSRGINVVLAYTHAMTAYALKCALLPWLPNNEGIFRPLTVKAPAGCILNATFPAPVGGRICSGDYVPALVFGALHQVIPDRVAAAAGSPLWSMVISGLRDDGNPFANILFYNGGMGATAHKDGGNALSFPNNVSSTPVEVTERDTPMFVHYKTLRPNSGGDGRFRGGLGQDVLLESESDKPVAVVFLAERAQCAAPGLDGGQDGGLGQVIINDGVADNRRLHVLNKGDKLLFRTPGAGGYGNPAQREPDAVTRDRQLGYRI
ncbi:MAG: hydantoinase B/oxoprolinase family protein, partial [Vulcanimicrobiaceae bacterium]